jgi:hypothetical protein
MKLSLVLGFLGVFALVVMSMGSVAYDWSGSESCGTNAAFCHPAQQTIVDEWKTTEHANSWLPFLDNTYCAKCHSPMQADFTLENSDDAVKVGFNNWEGVGCSSCHPDHHFRVEHGTPLGVVTGFDSEDKPIYEAIYSFEDLCQHCHGEKEYQGYGKIMEKKGVTCEDCHIINVPDSTADGHPRHTFMPTGTESCGVDDSDCHENKDSEWAQKQIDKNKMHGKGH